MLSDVFLGTIYFGGTRKCCTEFWSVKNNEIDIFIVIKKYKLPNCVILLEYELHIYSGIVLFKIYYHSA